MTNPREINELKLDANYCYMYNTMKNKNNTHNDK